MGIFKSAETEKRERVSAKAIEIINPPPVPAEDREPLLPVEYENQVDGLAIGRMPRTPIPFGVGRFAISLAQLREIAHEGRAGRVEGWASQFFLSLVNLDGTIGESITGDIREPGRRAHMQNELILRRADRIRRERDSASYEASRKRAEQAAAEQRAAQGQRDAEERRAEKQRALADARALCAEADGFTS